MVENASSLALVPSAELCTNAPANVLSCNLDMVLSESIMAVKSPGTVEAKKPLQDGIQDLVTVSSCQVVGGQDQPVYYVELPIEDEATLNGKTSKPVT
ncbi:hypothetical protein SLE2022_151720 [Rubroshorea leprosula]